MLHRLTCPHCETSYTEQRCGVSVDKLAYAHGSALVTCMVCQTAFRIEPQVVFGSPTVTRSRWLRRKTTVPGDVSVVVSTAIST